MAKRYIKLIISDENGRSEDTCRDVTDAMLQAAKECSYTLMTGERWADAKADADELAAKWDAENAQRKAAP